MRVALLGSGRTGGEVAKLHKDTVIFNSSNKPTLIRLQQCDVIVCFLTAEVFNEYFQLIIESKLPVVVGTTGFLWPENINSLIKSSWIKANNFSLGMVVIEKMIKELSKIKRLYPEIHFEIEDHHHKNKVDSPSGTGLSWKKWLNQKSEIISTRVGNIIGLHKIKAETKIESITLCHEVKDRALFASGALWAARFVIKNSSNQKLYDFNQVVQSHLEQDKNES